MAKYRLALPSKEPMNFAFGEINVLVGIKPTHVEEKYAQAIMKQYPGWIEKVEPLRRTAPSVVPTQKPKSDES